MHAEEADFMERVLQLAQLATRMTGVVTLALTVAGSALGPKAAWAETFVIPNGDVAALVAAIYASNTNGQSDEIILAADGTCVVDSISSSLGGGSAFPLIEPDQGTLQIRGNGATIRRDPLAEPMRFFYILDDASLYLHDLILDGGLLYSPIDGGGAIRVRNASLTIERSILRGNRAEIGTAIYASGHIHLTESEVRDNISENSTGAIVTDSLIAASSTFRGNAASNGGVILARHSVYLTNTTIAANQGFGVYVSDAPSDAFYSFSSVTMYGNTGTGIVLHSTNESPPYVDINNVVIAEHNQGCQITVPTNGSSNLAEDDSCPQEGGFDVVDDVLLAPLANNGGPQLPAGESPWTMVPLRQSPLVDSGNDEPCFYLNLDQLGNPRSVDGHGDGSAICDIGAVEMQPFQPTGLKIDPVLHDSDGNGVFEPSETVAMIPSWRYNGLAIQTEVLGEIRDFFGPGGAAYFILDQAANYGVPTPGKSFTCTSVESESCYILSMLHSGERPAHHWDATLIEDLYKPEIAASHRWTLHVGDSFGDVPRTNPFYRSVETMLHHKVTTGCGDSSYCPTATSSRRQMPVFVLKALEGPYYLPPACETDSERFSDVPATNPFCPWIEELANREVILGCGGGAYCPTAPVTRAQMAIFALKTLEGAAYQPPACDASFGMFADVPATNPFCPWIEELARRQVVTGCGAGNYCPSKPVTRGQMSVFVSRTFSLALYGP